MAAAACPAVLCTVLFVLLSVSSPTADTAAPSQAFEATALVDADARFDGRWGRASGNIALRVVRPIATWRADVAVLGVRAEIAHDGSGLRADFDANGLVASLARSLMPR